MEREADAQRKITEEQEKQNKVFLLRRGLISDLDSAENFMNQDMLGNLIWFNNEYKENQDNTGSIPIKFKNFTDDFGTWGDGLWSAVASASEDINLKLEESQSFFEIPIDRLNMLALDTEEYAKKVDTFGAKLQRFILAGGDFRGFDDGLNKANVNEDTLFNDASQIFDRFAMSKEEFVNWINDMKNLVKTLGLDERGIFTKMDDKSKKSHNFATRFLQTMGYDGVLANIIDDEEEGYNGNYKGSVIFNPDFKSIKSHITANNRNFKTNKEYEDYLAKNMDVNQKAIDDYAKKSKSKDMEFAQQNLVKQKNTIGLNIAEVTNAVNEKTEAFTKEKGEISKIVASEVDSLTLLEEKVLSIKRTIETMLNDIYTKTNVIHIPEINTEVFAQEGQVTDDVITKELDSLQKLRASLQLTTKRINTKTQAFETEGQIVTKVINSEINVLNRLQTVLNPISTQLIDIVKNLQVVKTSGNNISPINQPNNTKGSSNRANYKGVGNTLFDAKIETQFSSLSLLYSKLESTGKLTDEVKQEWMDLWDSLDKVKNTDGLQLWQQQLLQTKNHIEEITIANKQIVTENKNSFDQLIAVSKLYSKMSINAAKSTTPEVKAIYEQEANSALVEQQILLKNITLTKEQQAKYDDIEIERKKQLSLILAQQNGREKQIHDAQVEAEIVKQLIKLYEQLGQAQAMKNKTEASRLGGLISVERGKLTSIDYATNVKFRDARQKGYDTEQIKAENAALKERRDIIAELIKMSEELGGLTAKSQLTTGDNLRSQFLNELLELQKKFDDKKNKLANSISQEEQGEIDDSFMRGISRAANEGYRSLAKRDDRDEITRLKNIEKLEKEIGKLRAEANNTTNSNVIKALEQEIQYRKDLIDLQKQGKSLSAEDESFWKNKYSNDTKNAKKEERNQTKTLEDTIKQSQSDAGRAKGQSVVKTAQGVFDNAAMIEGIDIQYLENYKAQIDILKNTLSSIPQDRLVSEKEKAQLKEQISNLNIYTTEVKDLITNYEKLSGPNVEVMGVNLLGKNASVLDQQKQLSDMVKQYTKGRAIIKSYDATTNELKYTLKTASGEFTTYTASLRQADGALVTVRGQTTKTMGVMESVVKKVREFSYYLTGSMMIMRVVGWIREGVSAVKEIDSALIELKKVTDETSASYNKFLDTASVKAEKLGSTITDVISATAEFARLGYDMNTATGLAEAAIVYQNVGDGIGSASDAAESIISAMKGFGLEASNAMSIVDKFNEVGNNFAIDSKGVGDALTRSASALSAAGNSIDESIGLVTAANEVVQDPESVGTALKTLTMRLRAAKTEMEDEGLETEGMVNSTAKLRAELKALSHDKVDIMIDNDTFKNTTEILRETSQAWEDMTDIERASALELMGGKRQSNILSAIIQNFDTVENVIQTSANSANSALSENEKYLDSIEGKTNQFTNAVNTMWQDAIGSAPIKFIVDLGTGFIKLADGIDIADHKIGNLWTTLGLLIPLMIKTFNKMTWGEFFSSLGDSLVNVNTKIMGLTTKIASLGVTTTTTSAAMDTITVSAFKNALATAGLEEKDRLAILSKLGLANAANSQVIAQDKLTASTIDAMVAEGQLSIKQGESLKYLLGLSNATNEVNSARMNEILVAQGLDRKQRTQIINKLGLTGATKALTKEQVLQALSTHNLNEETKQAILAELGLLSTRDKLVYSTKKFLKSMGPMLTIAAIAGVIWGITKAIDAGIETLEEANEKLTETTNKFKEIDSKLQDMKSQLEEVNSAIEELNSQDTLSFADQEELQRLKAQREELERSIALSETYKKQQQKNVNRDAQNAANKYKNANFKSGKGKEETQQGWATGGAIAIGGTAAAVVGIAGGAKIATAIGSAIGTAIAPGVGTAIGAVLGAVVGGGIGALAGYGVGTAVSEGGTDVEEAMDQMIEKRKSLEEKYNEAREAYYNDTTNDEKIAKNYAKAEEELSKYDSKMAEHLDTMNSYYSQIDLNAETDPQRIRELRQEMNDFYDTQDKWAIAQGNANAKVNAFDRIFGENADEGLKRVKQAFTDAAEEGKNISLEEAFSTAGLNTADLDAFISRLQDMGLYAFEAENYFGDLIAKEQEAGKVSLEGVATDIKKVSEGVESLKDAFNECIEGGSVTADTLVNLKEKFGDLGDAWDNYVNVMYSGVASTKEMTEATEELMKAYFDKQLLKGEPITETEQMTYAIQLKSLGVENADEYVKDKVEENTIKAIENSGTYNKDAVKNAFEKLNDNDKSELEISGKKWEDLTNDEMNKIAERAKLQKEFSSERIKEIQEEYGVELDNIDEIINTLKEKEAAQQNILDLEKEQSDYNEWYEGDDGYRATEEKLNNLLQQSQAVKNALAQGNSVEDILGFSSDNWYRDYNEQGEEIIRSFNDKIMTPEDFNNMLQAHYDLSNSDFLAEYNELQSRLEDLKKEGEEKGYIVNGKIINPDYKKQLDDAQKEFDDFTNKIETELTADVKLNIEFQTKSNLVDDIQSVFDALAGAQKEYNENGYFSVDTLQSLLELEPKYLALLYDENGNLNLNKQTLYEVAQARLTDLGIQAQKNILETATTTATKGSIDAMRELTDATYDGVEANEVYIKSQLGVIRSTLSKRINDPKDELYGQDKSFIDNYIQGVTNQLDAVQRSVNIAKDNIANTLSSSGNTAKADTESALEKLQKRYEHQLSNLENQKTYVQNEIDRLEAEDKGVSKSYYEKQIAIEQQKMNVYKQERAALTNLLNSTKKGTDEWYEIADAIWETEHGIQSCATEMANLRKEIVELYQTVFDKMESAFGNMENLFSDRQSYIEKYMELLELQDEAKPASAYTDLIAQEEKKLANYEQELENLIRIRDNAVASGYLKEGSDEWIEMTDAIREQEAAVLDSKVAIAQYNDELKQLHVEAFEMVRDAFDARADFYSAQQDYIEGYIDQLDAMNVDVPEEVYRDLIDIEKKKQENLQANIFDARQGLADLEAAGYTAADEEWQNANNRIIEYEAQQQESITKTIEWNNAIRELDFTKFDRFIEKLQDLNSELDNIYKLTSRKDVANEDGTWTEDGLTSLATMYQQYELSKGQAKAYSEEIDRLTEAYARGEMSENTYNERLKELKEAQWDAIQTSEDLKYSIIDMCEARVDLIEDGIQKEIEAYQELIELKKEELSAERDLYDFKKDVEKQTKDIAELERKIASLSGADDAASIAERRKLEAQLLEAREDLDSSYRNHSLDAQADALDKELEAYQDASDEYIKSLRENLKDVEGMFESTMIEVFNNADVILQNFNKISAEYGITLTDNLKAPWVKLSEQATVTKNDIDTMLDATEVSIGMFNASVNSTIDQMYVRMQQTSSDFTAYLGAPYKNVTASGGPINTFSTKTESALTNAVDKAKRIANEMTTSNTKPWNDGVTAINTWSKSVESGYNKAIQKAKEYEAAANRAQNVSTPSHYSGTSSGSSGGNSGSNGGNNGSQYKTGEAVKTLQKFLNQYWNTYVYNATGKSQLSVDGIYGPATTNTVKAIQKYLNSIPDVSRYVSLGENGKFNANTRKAMWYFYDYREKQNAAHPDAADVYKQRKKIIPAAIYAKGTLGTKKDQWAITDEPQFGDELTLVPTKQGNLSYMRKGTSVVPAAITEELLKLANVGVDGLTMPKFDSGINIVTNAISKPEFNFSFDSMVHVDHCDEGTIKDLEKMVDTKINQFTRQMNYAIRKFK